MNDELLSLSLFHKHLGLAKVFWKPYISNNLHNTKKCIERHARHENRERLREHRLLNLSHFGTHLRPLLRPLEPAPHVPHTRYAQKVLVIFGPYHREFLLNALDMVRVGAEAAPTKPVVACPASLLFADETLWRVVVVSPDELVGEPARVRLSDELGNIDGRLGAAVPVLLLGNEGNLLRRDGARANVVFFIDLAVPPLELEKAVGRGIDRAAGGVKGDVGFFEPSPRNLLARGEPSGGDEGLYHARLGFVEC
mmetsp:Transcript_1869/g.4009  ORF Transcript_1869/g.4009 Transcript_1869/m.4009 type:complete len:253 (+) Transcript_1869:609-1367(+)